MVTTKRKAVIYAEKPVISAKTKAELKPLVYLAAIGVPFVVIMWALRKDRGVERYEAI